MNEDLLRRNLAGKLIGHPLYCYPSVGSTNDEASRLAGEGAPEGTAVIADCQTKGKGRMQRPWHSPTGSNIYTSVILRPPIKTSCAPQLSLVAGVTVAEVLNKYCEGRVELKWPNDVLIGGKKVCGILAEMKIAAGKVDFVIIGIGVNVNIKAAEFPSDLYGLATSLLNETGREISREELLICLYENLTKWYKKLLDDGFKSIRDKWLSLAPMIGCDLQIRQQQEVISGRAQGIAEDGSLMILTAAGQEMSVSAGDATILRENISY